MIIVEGPDNTGKSTLISKLIKDLNLTPSPFKFNPMDKEKGEVLKYAKDFYGEVIEFLKYSGENNLSNIIWDRSFLSELIYGPLIRGELGITLYQKRQLEKLIKDIKPLIILCMLPTKDILNTFEDREQYADKDNMLKIITEYGFMWRTISDYTPYSIKYNYKKDDYDILKSCVRLYRKGIFK